MTAPTADAADAAVLLDPAAAHRHTARCHWDHQRCAWVCPDSRRQNGTRVVSRPRAGARSETARQSSGVS